MEANVFNGINGASGQYLGADDECVLGAAVRRSIIDNDERADLRYHADEPTFGTAFGVDPLNLAEAGWAIIAAEETPEAVLNALGTLLAMRKAQAGSYYREFIGADCYRAGDTKRKFLQRQCVSASMPADPERMPYYVLLIGGPMSIPFDFQYQMGLQYAVGRLDFGSVEEYARYAESVVAAQTATKSPEIRLFAPRNEDDRATELSAAQLVTPLSRRLEAGSPGWNVVNEVGERATRARLLQLLCGEPVSLVFTACHGLGFPPNDSYQRARQGALVCQDWPGPVSWRTRMDDSFSVGGSEIAASPDPVNARIVFSFACYGAGTPQFDEYPTTTDRPMASITERPFVSLLPQRLLAHPRGGALAFIGHVERTWGYSILQPGGQSQLEVFVSALRAILNCWPVGHAMTYFRDRYAALGAELHEVLDGIRRSGDRVDDSMLARLWAESNDARSYIILGDPAVRL